jgi:hypothetical protein
MAEEVENLKCCGNCKHIVEDSPPDDQWCSARKDWTYWQAVCEKWEFDGLKKEQRKDEIGV